MELNLTFPVSKSLKQLDGDPGVWNPKNPTGWLKKYQRLESCTLYYGRDRSYDDVNEGIQVHIKQWPRFIFPYIKYPQYKKKHTYLTLPPQAFSPRPHSSNDVLDCLDHSFPKNLEVEGPAYPRQQLLDNLLPTRWLDIDPDTHCYLAHLEKLPASGLLSMGKKNSSSKWEKTWGTWGKTLGTWGKT